MEKSHGLVVLLWYLGIEFLHKYTDPGSSVGIATDYELKSRDSIRGRGKRFFFTPQGPYHVCDPISALSPGVKRLW